MFPNIFRTLANTQPKQLPTISVNPQGLTKVKSVVTTQKTTYCKNYQHIANIPAFECLNKPTRIGEEMVLKTYEFEDKIVHSPFPVVVNWHAEWCDPCHQLTPALRDIILKSEFVCCATLECEENLELMYHFQIKRLPTLMAFWEGYLVKKMVGLVQEEDVEKLVTKLDHAYQKRTQISTIEEVHHLIASIQEDITVEKVHSHEEEEQCKEHLQELEHHKMESLGQKHY